MRTAFFAIAENELLAEHREHREKPDEFEWKRSDFIRLAQLHSNSA